MSKANVACIDRQLTINMTMNNLNSCFRFSHISFGSNIERKSKKKKKILKSIYSCLYVFS